MEGDGGIKYRNYYELHIAEKISVFLGSGWDYCETSAIAYIK